MAAWTRRSRGRARRAGVAAGAGEGAFRAAAAVLFLRRDHLGPPQAQGQTSGPGSVVARRARRGRRAAARRRAGAVGLDARLPGEAEPDAVVAARASGLAAVVGGCPRR